MARLLASRTENLDKMIFSKYSEDWEEDRKASSTIRVLASPHQTGGLAGYDHQIFDRC